MLLDEATALDWLIDFEESAGRVERARTLADGLDSPLLTARLLMARGRCAVRLDRVSRGDRASRAIGRDRLVPRSGTATRRWSRLASSCSSTCPASAASMPRRSSARLWRPTAPPAATGSISWPPSATARSFTSVEASWISVIANLERAEALAVELGLTVARYRTTGSLAQLHFAMGDMASAAALAERAAELEAAGGARPGRILLLQAQIHTCAGRIDEAREAARRAGEGELSPDEAALLAIVQLGARRSARRELAPAPLRPRWPGPEPGRGDRRAARAGGAARRPQRGSNGPPPAGARAGRRVRQRQCRSDSAAASPPWST